MWNFTTIGPVEAELTHADRQTHRQTDRLDEANGHFSRVPERASNEGL